MSTELSITKSMLAKLLAGENINVVHRRCTSAGFDLATRTLYLPIWEDMDGELYDLLGGHEVGHALHTPAEGWHSETHDKDGNFLKTFKNVLNICEDARIEKKIRRTYPGLAKSFVAGYKSLFERDLFGVKELKDFSKLNILDRVNLYAKCGSFLIVPFEDDEKDLLREVMETETWEQVVEVARKLFEKAKEDQDTQLNSLEDLTEELMKQIAESMEKSEEEPQDGETITINIDSQDGEKDEEDGDDDTSKGPAKSDPSEEDSDKEDEGNASSAEDSDKEGEDEEDGEGSGDSDGDDDSEEDEDGEEGDSADGASNGGEGSGDEDPRSITDEIFREREKELIADGVEIHTYNLPKPVIENIIIPNKVWADNFYEAIVDAQKTYGNKDPIIATCSAKFNTRNKRYVNLLVKEFEMRKNARQYARTTIAKTGELDMGKLHQYKFTNDLFRKIAHVQKGKSHGMMIYVDMSGSMGHCFASTLEQMLILAAFCRKVNVPFDIYGFSDRADYPQQLAHKKKIPANRSQKFMKGAGDNFEVIDTGFHLVHLLTSQVQGSAYRRAFDMCCVGAYNWRNKLYPRCTINWARTGLDLGGTPFTQAVMASRPIIDKFKADNKVDIVNVIYLTDGDGTGCFNFKNVRSSWDSKTSSKIEQRIYMVDPKSKIRIDLGNPSGGVMHQTAMTAFVRQVTGCKHIGYYIASSSSAKSRIRSMNDYDLTKLADLDKFWRVNGWYAVPCYGYDQYYFIRDADLDATDEDYKIDEDMSVRKMAKTFSDAQSDKRKHRVLVSKFAQDIAA